MVERPLADRVAAALEHRDVERVDLRLEQHLGVAVAGRGPATSAAPPRRRRHLAREPLQRPVAAALHRRRHAGQRDDRADLLALAGELERRDVALDAVVVRGERRRAHQPDRAVLADQAAAGGAGAAAPTMLPMAAPPTARTTPARNFVSISLPPRSLPLADFDGRSGAAVPDRQPMFARRSEGGEAAGDERRGDGGEDDHGRDAERAARNPRDVAERRQVHHPAGEPEGRSDLDEHGTDEDPPTRPGPDGAGPRTAPRSDRPPPRRPAAGRAPRPALLRSGRSTRAARRSRPQR